MQHVVTPSFWVRTATIAVLFGHSIAGQAAIRESIFPDGTGSELFMSAFDDVSKTSYSLDLGVLMNDFFIKGQQDIGTVPVGTSVKSGNSLFWVIDPAVDLEWSKFVAVAAVTNIQWGVYALDAAGPNTAGGKRFYTTVTQGSERRFYTPAPATGNLLNSQFFNLATNAAGLGAYIPAVNQYGTHRNLADAAGTNSESIAINGSAFISADVANANDYFAGYFGNVVNRDWGPGSTVDIATTNAIGKSSWFYYVTSSGSSQQGLTRLDEFDNLGGDAYWGFAKEDGSNRFLLSYTLAPFVSARETAAGVTAGNNFARLAGIFSLNTPVGREESALTLTEGFLRGLANPGRLAAAADHDARALDIRLANNLAVAAVPEPESWALMALGLGTLGVMAARARRRHAGAAA